MKQPKRFGAGIVVVALAGTAAAVSAVPGSPRPSGAADRRSALLPAAAPSPVRPTLGFEANMGQSDREVSFLSRGPGFSVFLAPSEFVLRLTPMAKARPSPLAAHVPTPDVSREAVVRMRLLGSNPAPKVRGVGQLAAKVNYLAGAGAGPSLRGVPTYAGVDYERVYPGIDLSFHERRGSLEYDFLVAPGADPNRIALSVEGGDGLSVDRDGALVIETAAGPIRQPKPVVYQDVDGRRRLVKGRYLLEDNQVRFGLGPYDRSRRLVIDPALPYSTHLGGTGDDGGTAVATDRQGNAYVTGWTGSTEFPKEKPLKADFAGQDAESAGNCELTKQWGFCGDAFVAKLNPAGTRFVYSTYLAGSGADVGVGIAADSQGNAYVTGVTWSPDFPTVNPLPGTVSIFGTAFVAKLDRTGSALAYSTYLAGGGESVGRAVAVDGDGGAYVTGRAYVTGMATANFPTTGAGPESEGYGAFVTKLDRAGSSLVYSRLLGGAGDDGGNAIAVDAKGSAFLAGTTSSPDFPLKAAMQDKPVDGTESFVTKLSPSGTDLVYSTYLGGQGVDTASGIAVDAKGAAHVAGSTTSADFPTKNALQAAKKGEKDGSNAFVSSLAPNGRSLTYSTYMGGGGDSAKAIAAHRSRLYVTGTTAASFPTKDPVQARSGGGADAFVAHLDPSASGPASLVWSTFFGGPGDESGNGIAVSRSGTAYVTGATASAEGFPTANALQPNAGAGSGPGDAFVAAFAPAAAAGAPATAKPGTVAAGGSWKKLAATPRFFHTATRLDDGRVLVAGGCTEGDAQGSCAKATASAELFDPSTGKWTPTGSMTEERADHVAALLPGGKVLVVGRVTAEVFDLATGTWTGTTAPERATRQTQDELPTATALPNGPAEQCGANCGKVLLTGAGAFTELYDPATGKWSRAELSLNLHVDHTATILASGKVLVAGGRTTQIKPGEPAIDELYNPATGSWEPAAAMPARRGFHTSTAMPDGTVIAVGGRTYDASSGRYSVEATAETEIFDEKAAGDAGAKGAWRPTRRLNVPRYAHAAVPLPDGRVLVLGGSQGGQLLASAEAYDPKKGRWTAVAPMPEPRGGASFETSSRAAPERRTSFTATALKDGRVLVVGGSYLSGEQPAGEGAGAGGPTTTVEGAGTAMPAPGQPAPQGAAEVRTSGIASAAVFSTAAASPSRPKAEKSDSDGAGWLPVAAGVAGVAAVGAAVVLGIRRRRQPAGRH